MQQIIEFLRILGNRPLLAPNNKIGGQARRLAKWLHDRPDATDKEAQAWLKIPEGSSAYRKVKHHFRLYLLNSISATHTASMPEDMNRLEANTFIWNQLGAVWAGGEQCKNSQRSTCLHELNELSRIHDLQDSLTLGKVALCFENDSFEDSILIGETRKELYNGQVRGITRKHTVLSTFMNKTRIEIEEKVKTLEECIVEIDLFSTLDYPMLKLKKLYLEIKIALYENNLPKAIKIHDLAIRLLKPDEDNKQMLIVNFHANLLRCYMKSDKHQEGLFFAKQVLLHTSSYRYKFQLLELILIIAMKAEDYDFSIMLYQRLVNHPRYKIIGSNEKETIRIIKSYLSLLVSAKIIKTVDEDSPLFGFKIYRFLNELTFSQKEKSFRNTHAIIIKIIDHCINKRERDFELTESVKKYVQRHLSDPINNRTKNFILALLQHPEYGFNIDLTMKHADKYLKKMRSDHDNRFSQHAYIEILPYERIWKIITNTK